MKSTKVKLLYVIGCLLVMVYTTSAILTVFIMSRVNYRKSANEPTNEIVFNVDTMNVVVSPSFLNTSNEFSQHDLDLIQKAFKVMSVSNMPLTEALELSKKIDSAAKNNSIQSDSAFLIVHIESDFKQTAYNGKAYGLCQVTKPCLDEYNTENGKEYSLNDMFDPDLNLEVGFWYYNRLLTHYANYPSYGIMLTTEESAIRDAYIAYNIGITKFHDLGWEGRNQLRNGIYPVSMYGKNAGDVYTPITERYNKFLDKWMVS